MKKLISIILVVLTIFSLTATVSLAAKDEQLYVESVEFIDSYPISKMEIDPYDLAFEDTSESNFYALYLASSLPYKLQVTLSDGRKLQCNTAKDLILNVDENSSLIVLPYVTAADLVEAQRNNSNEITVTVGCMVSDVTDLNDLTAIISTLDFNSVNQFETKKAFCEQYVKSIKPISELSNTVYESAEYYEIGGKKFRIEYFDGTKKTYTVVENAVSADYSVPQFTLGGVEITANVFFGETEIFYIDNSYTFEVKEKAYPFKAINVKDYTFDEELGLTSITYEIVAKKTYERTVDLTPYLTEGELVPYFESIDAFRGFYVYIYNDTPEDDDSVFQIVLSIGETETLLEIENPNPTPKSLIARVIMFFVNLIKNIFARIFG